MTIYASLDPETRIVVQQRTSEIKTLVRRSVADVIEIGVKLAEVKDRLKHGQYGDWLKTEFRWSQDTAGRFINVAEQFGQIPQIADFAAASALYLLAAPSTPEAAREEAVRRVNAGQRITVAKAKIIIDQHRPERPPATEVDDNDIAAALDAWLETFASDRQRELALHDVSANGPDYQPPLRVRLPAGARRNDVRRLARARLPEAALGAIDAYQNGTGPKPVYIQPPVRSGKPRDLSLDDLRDGLLQLLVLPKSATNADVYAAVVTLKSAFEVHNVPA